MALNSKKLVFWAIIFYGMNICIREARAADVNGILDILNEAILLTTSNYDYRAHSLLEQQLWFEKKQKEGFPVIVATDGENLAGFGTYGTFRPKIAYQFSIEHSVYVSPHYQGKGIGSGLLKRLIETAKKQNYHTMIAGIDTNNRGSYLFHQKHGFVEIGRFKEIGYKFGQWLDLIFMQLLFNP